jgi:acyl-CoA synthetase (AMP-forming)/AMP-acid ligase II
MGFYSENRAEYVVAMLACFSDSITVVPINAKPNDVAIA